MIISHSRAQFDRKALDSTSNASLPTSQGFWNRFKTPKSNKEAELREQRQAQLALSRQRLLTLVFDEMETVRMVSNALRILVSHTTDHRTPATQLDHGVLYSFLGFLDDAVFMPCSMQELDALARDWIKHPPEMPLHLRVPIEFASLHATVCVPVPQTSAMC